MAFFVCVPVSFSGMFGNDTAGNYRNSTPFLQPMYKLIAVIAFIEHFTVAFSRSASLRLFFKWKLVLDTTPLFFADFMSFHVLYFTMYCQDFPKNFEIFFCDNIGYAEFQDNQYQKLLDYRREPDGQPEIVPEETEGVKRTYLRYLDDHKT